MALDLIKPGSDLGAEVSVLSPWTWTVHSSVGSASSLLTLELKGLNFLSYATAYPTGKQSQCYHPRAYI